MATTAVNTPAGLAWIVETAPPQGAWRWCVVSACCVVSKVRPYSYSRASAQTNWFMSKLAVPVRLGSKAACRRFAFSRRMTIAMNESRAILPRRSKSNDWQSVLGLGLGLGLGFGLGFGLRLGLGFGLGLVRNLAERVVAAARRAVKGVPQATEGGIDPAHRQERQVGLGVLAARGLAAGP